jgi:hypothetical protein
MTPRELAIARSVIYASLFDYPLTLPQLHHTLIESEQTPSEILAVYDGSARLQRIVDHRDGFFFPIGRADLVAERRRREARSRRFLHQHDTMLRLLCALPFTRLVALSGSVAHLNLEPDGDLDLFIVTRGRRVWTVTVAVLLLTKLLRRRRVVCANFVLADSHLALEPQDLFTASQVLHLKPLIGEDLLDAFLAANPFVTRFYPNATSDASRRAKAFAGRPGADGRPHRRAKRWARGFSGFKTLMELVLQLPAPFVEASCRRLYAWHLRRRAGSWRSPDQVCLHSDYLKLHTQSHRRSVLDRFDAAVEHAIQLAEYEAAPRAAAGGRRVARSFQGRG